MASSPPPTYHLHPPSDVTSNLLAPSSLPWYIGKPLGLLTTTAYIAILPAYLAYQTATYYAVGPPWPGWTLGTMLFTRGLRLLLQFLFKFGLPGADSNAWKVPIGAKVKGVGVECRKIPGIPKAEEDELRTGWARQRDVQVVDVPGFMLWPETQKNNVTNGHANNFEKRQSPAVAGSSYALANDGEKIVYYLVGGGYISGHPLRTHLAWTTSQKLNVRVFAVNYRKSLTVDTSFPACLLDALAGYLYLTRDLGFKPSNIILMGDSAGGNLCLGLSRYLGELAERSQREEIKKIGQVGGMILYSPWCDMTFSGASCITNAKSDYPTAFGASGVQSHSRHFPSHLASPYFSPSLPAADGSPRFGHLKRGGVKVYIQTGTAEILYDEDVQLARGMRDEGVDVRLRELEGEVHAAILFKRKKAMLANDKDLPEFWEFLS
ncbi:hypothetical protein NCC49_006028 [Naganishia albida]|nr:hypothetical protein NCC49_006028 [Naganishia albida]